ncbi:Uncharacterised protein [Vibrio cholerae]|nr:Uncharacterised protein [Vibrio cholerae]
MVTHFFNRKQPEIPYFWHFFTDQVSVHQLRRNQCYPKGNTEDWGTAKFFHG